MFDGIDFIIVGFIGCNIYCYVVYFFYVSDFDEVVVEVEKLLVLEFVFVNDLFD